MSKRREPTLSTKGKARKRSPELDAWVRHQAHCVTHRQPIPGCPHCKGEPDDR